MKRLAAVLAVLAPLLLVLQPSAQATPSTFCTDSAPAGEVPVEVVNTGGYFLAVVVWPFPTQQLVAVCYRIPGVAGGIVVVEAVSGTPSPTSTTSTTVVANMSCSSDGGYPNSVNCANQLGGAGITVNSPVSSTVGPGSSSPCVVGGTCLPVAGRVDLATTTSTVTLFLPLGGSVSPAITFPIGGCLVNLNGPC